MMRWVSYVRGWQKRWFVMEAPGVMTYYKNYKKKRHGAASLVHARAASNSTNRSAPCDRSPRERARARRCLASIPLQGSIITARRPASPAPNLPVFYPR